MDPVQTLARCGIRAPGSGARALRHIADRCIWPKWSEEAPCTAVEKRKPLGIFWLEFCELAQGAPRSGSPVCHLWPRALARTGNRICSTATATALGLLDDFSRKMLTVFGFGASVPVFAAAKRYEVATIAHRNRRFDSAAHRCAAGRAVSLYAAPAAVPAGASPHCSLCAASSRDAFASTRRSGLPRAFFAQYQLIRAALRLVFAHSFFESELPQHDFPHP